MTSLKYIPEYERPSHENLLDFLNNSDSLKKAVTDIANQQKALSAESKQSLLIIFQAMDAAGKDSTIRRVFAECDPGFLQAVSFKAPSAEERSHDFMWRCYSHFPAKGNICIFNRSYYEETLVVRVHPKFLKAQGIDKKPTQKFWDKRFKFINQVEKHLSKNGTKVLKFFLDVSQTEQHYRFIRRYSMPEKQWKFNTGDLKESNNWQSYQNAFNDLLEKTSTKYAPWYVIPADNKPLMRRAVASIIQKNMFDMKPQYPSLEQFDKEELILIDEMMSNYKNSVNKKKCY